MVEIKKGNEDEDEDEGGKKKEVEHRIKRRTERILVETYHTKKSINCVSASFHRGTHINGNKFVRTMMRLFNATLFSILFSFYGCHLVPLNCTVDFKLISQ